MKQTNALVENKGHDNAGQMIVGQIIDDIVAHVLYVNAAANSDTNKNKIETKKNKTKGTGAGGAQTNKNGLPYESLTDLKTEYTVVSTDKYCSHIKFPQCDKTWVSTGQSKFFKCMEPYMNKTVYKAHGCKHPDECYVDHCSNTIFILEKKFQHVTGSVCEKIQTSSFKIWEYSRMFPDFRIVYMYCLSDWFKTNCKAELEYLELKNVPVFWGNDTHYKNKIIDFIIDCI